MEKNMNEYHKILTIFKRDGKALLEGQWTHPEFEYLADNTWVFTEKVDGTNIRVMFTDDTVTFGGKTNNAQIPAALVTRLNELFQCHVDKMNWLFSRGVCLYGEGYGAKIQNGGKYTEGQDFVLFDVKTGDHWLRRDEIEDIARNLGIGVVPIIGEGSLHDAIKAVKE
jgi:ATP-dependent RNA circularization protein (DNA/RNA ligase family)